MVGIMPIKRRMPKGRLHRVTPAAVDAFRAGDYAALHRALGLRPWETSPLEVDDGPCPWSGNSAGAASWPQAQELRDELLRLAAR
jgi:hypothetical protein